MNIRYYHQDLHRGPLRPPSRAEPSPLEPRALLLDEAWSRKTRFLAFFAVVGRVWAARLSAIHFQGWFIRQVSCYTLLSGFRLPWPPSCCLNEPTPFVVSNERAFRHLNSTFGSSRIASSAYQKWPTKNSPFAPGVQGKFFEQPPVLTYLKFENRLKSFRLQDL